MPVPTMNPLYDDDRKRVCGNCLQAEQDWEHIKQKDRIYFQEVPGGKFHFRPERTQFPFAHCNRRWIDRNRRKYGNGNYGGL